MNHTDIEGWFDAGTANLYSHAVWKNPGEGLFVEVGSYKGKSAAFMAEQINLAGKHKLINFQCVDMWKSYGTFLAFQRNIMQCGLNHLVKPIRCPSNLAVLQYKDESISFLFIDGDHKYNSIKEDILLWSPKVKNGGVLGIHDIHLPSVRKAVDECLGLKNGQIWDKSFVYEI